KASANRRMPSARPISVTARRPSRYNWALEPHLLEGARTMASPDTDKNLLFGVLAFQADLLDAQQFAEDCSAWAAKKDVPLADLLVERGWLTSQDRADVERLLERKLKRHRGDVQASWADIKHLLADPVVQQSLNGLAGPDPNATQALTLPVPGGTLARTAVP